MDNNTPNAQPPAPSDSADTHKQEQPTAAAHAPSKKQKKTEKTIDWGKFNDLLEDFVLIYGTDTVYDGCRKMIMKISNMGHAHGSDMVRMWKNSALRRTVMPTDVLFDPTMQCDPDTTVNLYDGLAIDPKPGDVTPMLDLIRYLTSRAIEGDEDECDQIMHWLLCWLAYPLQHPGFKLRTAVVMHGDEGAGKNFLFDSVVMIYGKYGAVVGQDELEDKFNDWRSGKLFVVGDEVSSRAELVHNKNRLKALITSPAVQINPKNLPRREETNHMNIVFLSNELQPLALDNSDRRYLVVYTPPAKPFAYYQSLAKWRSNGGLQAFAHYLMTYPIGDFDPYAPAPMTESKASLIAINRKSPEHFWQEWEGGEIDLPYVACSMQQAYRAYIKWCNSNGERFPLKREQFTPTLLRFAEGQGKPVKVKVMKLDSLGAKKAERMLLVAEPSPDIPQGKWATECVESFAEHLKKYIGFGFPRSPDSGEAD